MSNVDAVKLEVKWESLETHGNMPLGENLKVDG